MLNQIAMSTNDDLNSLKGSDGIISEEDYLEYVKAHLKQEPEEEYTLLEIHMNYKHFLLKASVKIRVFVHWR